ncbi:hypothetical protein FBY21_4516 [Pseudomonas sp. SLBN-26]|uniref:hypothetical protein n=1 Tax=Pseudomonadaceae TaxID=135621 RepID=UPI00114F5BC0|nr:MULTISPECIES: hypothetical protein [Pseudomonas]MCP1619876.1 hypothetical protein [Pseudomonas otitidis]TQL09097.1 hypothetical protein FBY21_4516 [Pseudomonas sp. SLBN-26]
MENVRSFLDVKEKLGLKRFLSSELGTLYFVPYSLGSARIMVRHFDSELNPESVSSFVDMLSSCKGWVEALPGLAEFVRVEQPLEIGLDFVSRPHHTYYISTDSYVEEYDPAEAPPELELMRKIVRESIGVLGGAKNKVIEKIMKRSLLEPATKTYFNSDEMKFIVVEPRFLVSEVEAWAKS